MGKRFTESTKWSDRWFRKLSPEHKLMFLYLLDNCDQAGTIELDKELAEFQIGLSEGYLKGSGTHWEDLVNLSEGRLRYLANGRLWLTKFIDYQCGVLSESCNAHKPILALIQRFSIPINEPLAKGTDTLGEPLAKGPGKGIRKGKGKGKGKKGECEGETDSDSPATIAIPTIRQPATEIVTCPPSVDPRTWHDWLAVRKAKRLVHPTASVMARMQSEADKAGIELAAAIQMAAERSWGGFEASWLQKQDNESELEAMGL